VSVHPGHRSSPIPRRHCSAGPRDGGLDRPRPGDPQPAGPRRSFQKSWRVGAPVLRRRLPPLVWQRLNFTVLLVDPADRTSVTTMDPPS